MDAIEFSFGITVDQILSGFKNGRYSIAWNLAPSDVDALLHESEFASRYQEIPSLATQYICFNIHRGPFSDENVRQRFVQSIDWDSLIRRKLGRVVARARTLTPPALLGYEPPDRRTGSFQRKSSEPIELTVIAHGIYLTKYADFTKDLVELLKEKGFLLKISDGKLEESLSLKTERA